MPNVLSPRDLVSRPDHMDETVPHTQRKKPFGIDHLKYLQEADQGHAKTHPLDPKV